MFVLGYASIVKQCINFFRYLWLKIGVQNCYWNILLLINVNAKCLTHTQLNFVEIHIQIQSWTYISSPGTTNYEFTFTNRINYKFLELLGDKSNCGTQTSHRSVNIKAKPRALVSCQGISSWPEYIKEMFMVKPSSRYIIHCLICNHDYNANLFVRLS